MAGSGRRKGSGSNQQRTGDEDDEVSESPSTKKLRISLEYKWFDHPDVSEIVTKNVKGNYHEHGPNWTDTKPARREQYWKWFKNKVDYPKDEKDQVRAEFTKVFSRRLSSMVSRAAKNSKAPKWMGDTLHAELLAYRQTEAAKKKSDQAQANRKANAGEDGKALGTHTMGRTNSLQLMEKLANGGDYPPAIELLKATKKKKKGGYVSKKAENIAEVIDAEISELESQGVTNIDKDKVYLEKCGFDKKGGVYGVGAAGSYYFERPATGSRETNNTAKNYSPGILPRLLSKYEESERRNKLLEERVLKLEALNVDPNCNSGQPQTDSNDDDDDDDDDDDGIGGFSSIPVN